MASCVAAAVAVTGGSAGVAISIELITHCANRPEQFLTEETSAQLWPVSLLK